MAKVPENITSEIKEEYVQKDNTFIRLIKPDLEDRLEVEIGDIKQPDTFYPQIKIKSWDNEVNASFRIVDNDPEEPQILTEQQKIKYVKNKWASHLFFTYLIF